MTQLDDPAFTIRIAPPPNTACSPSGTRPCAGCSSRRA